MARQDDQTLGFYSTEAEAYTGQNLEPSDRLEHFMTHLPRGAKVLELGCGSGRDSERLIACGFDVTPTDGTPEIAREAGRRLGRPVQVLLFGDLDVSEAYDGIWANACLLHVPRASLGPILFRIRTALKPGGIFYASYKSGLTEGRDRFDRYFNYPSADWLRDVYGTGWRNLTIEEAPGDGYDNQPTDWLHVTAFKPT